MNQPLNPSYWSDRYQRLETGWDTGAITTPLKEYFDQLIDTDVYILIPGAGNAYEAEYLVSKGFTNVYVCDFAPEPLQNLKKRCPAIKEENLLLGDFFELNTSANPAPGLQFDLIVEQTFFCALDPGLRPAYFKKMQTLLKPGGRLVGLLFNDRLNSDHPPFGGSLGEYLSYIDSGFKIKTFEACYNSIKPRLGRELFINLVRM